MSDYKTSEPSPVPSLNPVSFSDIRESLRLGWQDFRNAPLYGIFFGAVYAIGGCLIFWLLSVYQKPWMIVPIAIGFPLLGPFLAAGTYEVSRRMKEGEPLDPAGVLGFMIGQGKREFAWMAFVILFIFWIWMYQARVLIALFLEMKAFSSVEALASAVFTTPEGLTMIAIGTISGGILATILFTTTVVAMPLLVERDIDIVTALITSWKSVLMNPVPMLCWGAAIGAITLVAMLPMFLGLLVTFPVTGFATWHLYKAITEQR